MVSILRHPRVLAIAVMALFAWLLRAGQPVSTLSPTAQTPAAVGPWSGTPLTDPGVAPAAQDSGSVALMEYRLGQEPPVWLSEVDGVGTRAAFHPPELCFVGSNLEILERTPITVFANGTSHRVMRLVVGQNGHRYESWYWFTANDRVTPNYYQQQLWLAVDSVRREPVSGALVRISTPAADGSEASRRRLLAFFTSLTAPLASSTPPLARHGV